MPTIEKAKKPEPETKPKKGYWVFSKGVTHGDQNGRKKYEEGDRCPDNFLKFAKEHGMVKEV